VDARGLFETLVERCKSEMGICGKDDLERFDDLVAVYRQRIGSKQPG